MTDGIFTTACPRNCYSTCTLRVQVEQGRIRRIEPHPANRAADRSGCIKGLSYLQRVYAPERILYPLKRIPQTDAFERISWDEALATIAAKLSEYKQHFGPQSILYYAGSGTKGLLNEVGMAFWRLFGGCTTTYGDLCWPAGLEATRLTLGENKHNAPWDLQHARLIMLWGKNPAETNVHQMTAIHRARSAGARLVVIDPRRTPSAERAELLLQPRPGSDGALALGLACALIGRAAVDHDFINRHVLGFEAFRALALQYPLPRVAALTDIPEPLLQRLVDLLAWEKPLTICAGFGMQRYTNAGQTMRALIALLAITGNIGKPGAGWVYANLQSHIFSAVQDPLASYPPGTIEMGVRTTIPVACLGPAMLATQDPPLKMIWVERGNPVAQNPETHTVQKAFRALDFRVVVEQFMTDTARMADMVLPAKTLFEQSDVIGAYWHSYIQLKQKLIDPPGEVKPESEIYFQLARKLGYSEAEISQTIPLPGDGHIDEFLRRKLAPFGIRLDDLRAGPILAPGTQEVVFADGIFATPSGKIELYSQAAAERWGVDPLPAYREPHETAAAQNSQSAKYPLMFMTPNTKNRIHSQFNNLELIRQFSRQPFLAMHPADAAARSLGDGDQARIFNDRGELHVPVRFDFSLKQGCVVMTNGWWIEDGGTVNFLSRARQTDMGYGAAFHDNAVEVERHA